MQEKNTIHTKIIYKTSLKPFKNIYEESEYFYFSAQVSIDQHAPKYFRQKCRAEDLKKGGGGHYMKVVRKTEMDRQFCSSFL